MSLLNLRRLLKKRKPVFLAQDWYKRKRIRPRWRRPRGLHSKMRLQKRGKPAVVSSGWRSPRAVRGLNRQGLREVIIHTEKDLSLLGEGMIGVFHRQVSLKKRLELIRLAEEKGLLLDAKQVATARKAAEKREAQRKQREARSVEKQESVKEEGKEDAEKAEKADGKAEGESVTPADTTGGSAKKEEAKTKKAKGTRDDA